MGTVSAQLAHALYLAEDSQSLTSSARWTPTYITESVIPWLQHIDIIWPTLDESDRQTALAHAIALLHEHTEYTDIDQSTAQKYLDTTLQRVVLGRLITNPNTQPPSRIVSVHHLADTDRGGLVIAEEVGSVLDEARDVRALNRMIAVLSEHIKPKALRTKAQAQVTQCTQASNTAESAGALGWGLLKTLRTKDEWEEFSATVFGNTRAGGSTALLQNAALAAALNADSAGVFGPVLGQFTKCILFERQVDVKLNSLVRLDGWVLGRLSWIDRDFARAYMMQLAQLNKRCQIAMLRDLVVYQGNVPVTYDDMAKDPETISNLVDKWCVLFADEQVRGDIRGVLERDKVHLDMLIKRRRQGESREVFDDVVGFWNAFYDQFLGKRE